MAAEPSSSSGMQVELEDLGAWKEQLLAGTTTHEERAKTLLRQRDTFELDSRAWVRLLAGLPEDLLVSLHDIESGPFIPCDQCLMPQPCLAKHNTLIFNSASLYPANFYFIICCSFML